jgi:hypothetical protein
MATIWKSLRPLQDTQYAGEYQLFDGNRVRPGFVKTQWTGRSYNDIAQLVKPPADDERANWWHSIQPTDTILRRLFPNDNKHSIADYKLLYCIESTPNMPQWRNKGAIILKGVLKNKSTSDIVLLASHSTAPDYQSQLSVAGDWHVLTADTVGPPLLWGYFK